VQVSAIFGQFLQAPFVVPGGVLGDGANHNHHHQHSSPIGAPVAAAAAAPAAPAASFAPAVGVYTPVAAAPPPPALPAAYAPENLAYTANEQSGMTTSTFSEDYSFFLQHLEISIRLGNQQVGFGHIVISNFALVSNV